MMYPYIALSDNTEITHSHILEKDGIETVEVHFERPSADGFCSARCELPSYRWLFNDGFSADEVSFFDDLLHHNAHLLFKYARSGGVQCA